MKTPPLEIVATELRLRQDIALSESTTPSLLVGCQLRRQWAVTRTPTTFSEISAEHWFYYGQLFVVMERRLTADGDLRIALKEKQRFWDSVGGWIIFVDPENPLQAVYQKLGDFPEKWAEYVRRQPK